MSRNNTRKRTDFKHIIRIDSELNQIHDFDLLLERILFEARKVVHADAGSIYIKEAIEDAMGEKVEKLAIKYSQNDTTERELPPGQKPIYSFLLIIQIFFSPPENPF